MNYVVDIIKYFIDTKKTRSGIYNLGSGKLTSNLKIYQLLKNLINKKYNKLIVDNFNVYNRNIWSSNYKIEKTLNKKLNFSINFGLKETVKNFIKD